MEPVILDFLQKLVLGLLSALLPVLIAWVGAKARLVWAKAKKETQGSVWDVEEIAALAVKAAEQAGLAGHIESKKVYALELAEQWLASRGFPIDLEIIDAAIEAAVWEEINKDRSTGSRQLRVASE